MKNRSYRREYRRHQAARPSSYAAGFVIPRHACGADPKQIHSGHVRFVSPDLARAAARQPVSHQQPVHRIESGSRSKPERFDPVRFAEAMAKVASVVLTAGNGLLLTVLFN